MKKKYITPACITVSMCIPLLLPASQNEYWSDQNGDQGLVHFESSTVDAGDGD